jgi:hypothetical protein
MVEHFFRVCIQFHVSPVQYPSRERNYETLP